MMIIIDFLNLHLYHCHKLVLIALISYRAFDLENDLAGGSHVGHFSVLAIRITNKAEQKYYQRISK